MISELLIGYNEDVILNKIKDKPFYEVLETLQGSKVDGNILPNGYVKDKLSNYSNDEQIRIIIANNFNLDLIPRNKKGRCIFSNNLNFSTYFTIKNIPNNFTVNGSFTISGNSIEKLPKGLHINGDLEADNCNLVNLPSDLYVGKNLYITNNDIKNIPESIHVGGKIYITKNKNLDLNNIPNKFEIWDMDRDDPR